MSNGLFVPGPGGSFSQQGNARLTFISTGKIAGRTEFIIDSNGSENDIMAMIHQTMTQYPQFAKMFLTVFWKFCQDRGIPMQDVKKHTHFAGQ